MSSRSSSAVGNALGGSRQPNQLSDDQSGGTGGDGTNVRRLVRWKRGLGTEIAAALVRWRRPYLAAWLTAGSDWAATVRIEALR